jgi:hypothetical protein
MAEKMKTTFSKDEKVFLDKLNNILLQKEQELQSRCKELFDRYNKRLAKNGGDLDDFEVEIVIEYWVSGSGPQTTKYIYCDIIRQAESTGPLTLFALNDDFMEEHWPRLSKKWCYLLHALYAHSNLGKRVFNITMLDFEIQIREQQFVKMGDCEYFA